MFFLLLYQYVFCLFKYVKPNEIIDNKSVKEEDTFEISPFSNQAKHKSDIFLLNVSKTSYFRPLKIDLNQVLQPLSTKLKLNSLEFISLCYYICAL